MDARLPIAAVLVAILGAAAVANGAPAVAGAADIAAAASPSAATAAAEVAVHGTSHETAALEDILRDLLALRASLKVRRVDRVDAAEVIRPAPRTPGGLDVVARAWIDLDDAGQITIYVVDRGWERILVRHLDRGAGPSEVALESAARVVATAVEALLAGAQIGVVREEIAGPSTPAAETAVPARPMATGAGASASAVHIGVLYGAELFAPKLAVVHGPGISIGGAAGAGRAKPGASLTGQLWLPSTVIDATVGLRLFSGSLRLLGTVDYPAGSPVVLNAGLGGGVDITRVEALALEGAADVHPTAVTNLTTAVLRAAVGASFRLRWGLGLSVTGVVDADLSRTHYVVRENGETYDFLRPWTVRPGLMLGVTAP